MGCCGLSGLDEEANGFYINAGRASQISYLNLGTFKIRFMTLLLPMVRAKSVMPAPSFGFS